MPELPEQGGVAMKSFFSLSEHGGSKPIERGWEDPNVLELGDAVWVSYISLCVHHVAGVVSPDGRERLWLLCVPKDMEECLRLQVVPTERVATPPVDCPDCIERAGGRET